MRASTHFKVGENLILDNYSGADLAYSFRKLNSIYSGPCIRVRRSTDSAEQNIGFVNDYIDKVSLQNFIGSASGFISVFYDQSGNQINWIPLDNSKLPYVALNGVINDYNGKVVMMSSTSSHKLITKTISLSNATDFQVIEDNTSNTVTIGNGGTNNDYYGAISPGSTLTALSNSGVTSFFINGVQFTGTTRGQLSSEVRIGSPVIFSTKANLSAWTRISSAYYGNTTVFAINRFFEKIQYPSDRADRAEIESAINEYYSLY